MKLKYAKKYYEYLDNLKESGTLERKGSDMLGAAPYLRGKFPELNTNAYMAEYVLRDWRKTFVERHPQGND